MGGGVLIDIILLLDGGLVFLIVGGRLVGIDLPDTDHLGHALHLRFHQTHLDDSLGRVRRAQKYRSADGAEVASLEKVKGTFIAKPSVPAVHDHRIVLGIAADEAVLSWPLFCGAVELGVVTLLDFFTRLSKF